MNDAAHWLNRYRREPSPTQGSTSNPFKMISTLAPPAMSEEVDDAWNGRELPADAADLWAACREARLFEDVEYGQWGLALLSPSASAARTAQGRKDRPTDLRPDDVVIGEFLGDQEWLVLAPSETGQRKLLIALPLDSRADWFGAASSLAEFLGHYFNSAGDKYWERKDAWRNSMSESQPGVHQLDEPRDRRGGAPVEPLETPSAAEVSEAIVVWTGWGRETRPARDEARLAAHFEDERARDLLPILRRLEAEFYESDARFRVADLAEMGDTAAARFRQFHPELTEDSIEALAWCYSYDFK